jgi:hypothetical protein
VNRAFRFAFAGAVLVSQTRWAGAQAEVARPILAVATDTAVTPRVSPIFVAVDVEPGRWHVIAVHFPPEVSGCSGRYELRRESALQFLGRTEGAFAKADTGRVIALSVATTAGTPAGRLRAAAIRFQCDDGRPPVDLPIVLAVHARVALSLEAIRSLVGVRAGSRVRAEVAARNNGNSAQPVEFSAQLPRDWRWRVSSAQPPVLQPGMLAIIELEITVPASTGTGDYGAVIRVGTAGVSDAANTAFTVRVSGATQSSLASRGLTLGAATALVREPSGASATVIGLAVDGELAPAVRAFGRVTMLPPGQTIAQGQRSLARLGTSPNVSYLRVVSDRWGVGLGHVGDNGGSITGGTLSGVGVVGNAETVDWRGSVLAVQPTQRGRSENHLVALGASRHIARIWSGVALADLREESPAPRAARVASGDVFVPLDAGSLHLQLGSVTGNRANGLAWRSKFEQRFPTLGFSAAAGHVPGGSASFANAEDEIASDAYHTAGRWTTSGAYWRSATHDRSRVAKFTSTGLAAGERVAFGSLGAASLEGRASRSTTQSALGMLQNGESILTTSWIAQFGAISSRVGGAYGSVSRGTSLGALSARASAPQTSMFGAIVAQTHAGNAQFDAEQRRTGPGVGAPRIQTMFATRVYGVPIVTSRLTFYGEHQVNVLGASRATRTTIVAGVRLRVGRAWDFAVDAERDGAQQFHGDFPWTLAARLQTGVDVPALGGRLAGLVFVDRNYNGVRDAGEEGVRGVIVQMDGVLVTTDSRGRFDIGSANPGRITIDPRSLPEGWVAVPRGLSRASAGPVLIAVIPTAPLVVTLRLLKGPGVDPSKVELNRATVSVTDAEGRRWDVLANASGLATFDALPPGTYSISADLTKAGEELIVPVSPHVTIGTSRTAQMVDLPIGPRPIRITPQQTRSQQVGGKSNNIENPRW